ncbi:Deoxyuridine 5'-triphosphate nucleotidohydrolase [Tritonibacter multivorans]|uniref:dUTP diphosphatase n=1 Tax=Tritonibacter multivorans TaxID=928856 RepID=A0A0P1GTH3_9RHOB|nr:dUTP diphosphatase [Tritonibacter multivorans]MDA7422778.1 dUTP diphosphatase [Tritonibacter multivorans]CUH77367.1 Deoxyuridine 5'-triphosphate nucleotidohydrolase [Tritonibacter multivorans]SFD60226.1 deoxyuridine 5'-triphosphate nucleotidohydrolase [Tritonibacter multivorans]
MLPATPAIELKVLDARLNDWGLPGYQSDMAAAVDLFACIDDAIEIAPQAPATLVPSGLALGMGNAHMAALIMPRSGLGHKKGLVMGNTVGLIDADYMGQVFISVWNRNPVGSDAIVIEPGERIAQMMFVPVVRPQVNVVEEFSEQTARGAGGFGSTGTTQT